MAVLALQPKETSVDFRLGMAAVAFGWGAFEDSIGMALLAVQGPMSAIQREEVGVVESAHAVSSVVAVQAACPILLLVNLDKFTPILGLRVTFHAFRLHRLVDVLPVATGTGDRNAIPIQGVTNQVKTG